MASNASGNGLASERGYCEHCGQPTGWLIPDGDNRERRVCGSCGTIHYDNPKTVVGCLLHWQGRILLCRRAIEPRRGYWTLPAGFMENRETAIEGAARESYEEARARCSDLRLFSVYSLPRISQIYLMFIGTLVDGHAEAGEETLEVALLERDEIPWTDIAFPVVADTLSLYLDGGDTDGRVYSADVFSRPGAPLDIRRHSG